MNGKIAIENKSKKITEINIQGIIGVQENAQFEKHEEKIATYEKFQEKINEIALLKTKKIIVNIRSTGGNVNDALLIYDTLKALNTEITTRCYGYVASAATIIAQAASKGKREISKNALYLIHQASSAIEGNAAELTSTAELLSKTDERIANIYTDAAQREKQGFVELMKENNGNGKWLSAEETIKSGLADKLIAPKQISNEAKNEVKKMNLPDIPDTVEQNAPKKTGKFKKKWNEMIESLKMMQTQSDQYEDQVVKLKKHIQEKVKAIAQLEKNITEYQNPNQENDNQEIKNLQNRIVELEAMNAKLKAKATQTMPKEDPGNQNAKKAGNQAAYEEDIKKIINN